MASRRTATGMGIRVFDVALRAVLVALAGLTIAWAILVMLYLTERGPLAVPAKLAPPYGIEFLDANERSIVVGEAGSIVNRTNFGIGEESRYIKTAPTVIVEAKVDRADFDTRALLSVAGTSLLALTWAVAVSLYRIVRTAAKNDPFAPANVVRLRTVAASILLVPVVGEITVQVLRRTLDSDPPMVPVSPGWAWLGFVVVALGVFALAEVFGSGAELREFEMETV